MSRDLSETRALVIKTNNQLSALSADVRGVAKSLEARERAVRMNSAVVYLIFAAALTGAFYFIHRARVERASFERDAALREAAAVREELTQVRRRVAERTRAETRAFELFQLMQSGRPQETVAAYPEVSRERLSRVEAEVLRQGVVRSRRTLSGRAFEAGRRAYEAGNWKRAAQDLRRAIELEGDGSRGAVLHYLYGISLYKLADYTGALTQLERSVELGAEKTVRHDVAFYVAAALDQSGKRKRAVAAYRRFLTKYPKHHLQRMAQRRLKELQQKP